MNEPQERSNQCSKGTPLVPSSSWAQQIMTQASSETRVRPWVKEFGIPVTSDVGAEDWIEYPACFNVSKKGIAG